MGTKITASLEQVFCLRDCSGDDTIILLIGDVSSLDIYLCMPVSVGAGAGFSFVNKY